MVSVTWSHALLTGGAPGILYRLPYQAGEGLCKGGLRKVKCSQSCTHLCPGRAQKQTLRTYLTTHTTFPGSRSNGPFRHHNEICRARKLTGVWGRAMRPEWPEGGQLTSYIHTVLSHKLQLQIPAGQAVARQVEKHIVPKARGVKESCTWGLWTLSCHMVAGGKGESQRMLRKPSITFLTRMSVTWMGCLNYLMRLNSFFFFFFAF